MNARPAVFPFRCRNAFTFVEMLAVIAALVIVLGLMINLSQRVRNRSADDWTRLLLRRLDQAMGQYVRTEGRVPEVRAILEPSQSADETVLRTRAGENNRDFIAALQRFSARTGAPFPDLSISYFDGMSVRDAWGHPIVLMPAMHPAIGMSPKGWFFFSAGRDGNYLTREDNLYSYEDVGE